MSELYLMVTITNRNMLPKFLSFYQERNMEISLIMLGKGTANSEMLDYFGLEDSEKAVIFGVVTDSVWLTLKKGLQSKLQIDIPGTGIAFTIPLSSIGGKRELLFLTENQAYEKGAESTLTGCTHDLLLVIANQGYSELVMEAARSAGAARGHDYPRQRHGHGTGGEVSWGFAGIGKEMIFIITKTEEKNQIMQAVMRQAGMQSKAKSIVISLPVTSTAGLRLVEEE